MLCLFGYEQFQDWENGVSYQLGATYVVLEQSPALLEGGHQRCRAGLNHLAFHAGTRANIDAMVDHAGEHGWHLMFPDQHPFAGGPDTYAAYLEDDDGYEVELVAT
ncbi:MAG: VOC family protein [Actinomycetota bacterium]|nr:VOC family protein [Actinomycetota bacterium]